MCGDRNMRQLVPILGNQEVELDGMHGWPVTFNLTSGSLYLLVLKSHRSCKTTLPGRDRVCTYMNLGDISRPSCANKPAKLRKRGQV